MTSLYQLKCQLEILKAIPDYYDTALVLLAKLTEVEREAAMSIKAEMDKFSKSATDMWVDIVSGKTEYAVYAGKAYKISAAPLEVIPQGAKTLYITPNQ